ncbi:18S rRNA (guanine-N(7))-methyltransferase-like [Styela clava]
MGFSNFIFSVLFRFHIFNVNIKMSSHKRPELQAPPEIFYNENEAQKYTTNSRMMEIQAKMTERALELLNLPEDSSCFILDVGCGSGLSGETITEMGHCWIGFDISTAMLNVAVEREVEGDIINADAGEGLFFKPGTFDGVISISAIQWLCYSNVKSHNPPKRLYNFFSTLYSAMRQGSRAVFQLYPENPSQLELITTQATRAGFSGGVIIDYPNSTKAKKIFLCLFCGVPTPEMPSALGTGDASNTQIHYNQQRISYKQMKGKSVKKSKDWITAKKERLKRQGKQVKPNTKYTGRKRRSKF